MPWNDISPKVSDNGTKLSSMFNIKDETPLEHKSNLVHKINCPENNCNAVHIGETGRRLSERIKEHGDIKGHSHVAQHTLKTNHRAITMQNVKLHSCNRGSAKTRKIKESLYVRKKRPSINKQETSLPLKLFT